MKILKIGGLILLFLLLIITTIALFINFSGIPKYPTEEVKISIKPSSEQILRGKKLASMLCVNCHKDAETGRLTGTKMRDLPTEFGTAYTPNITNHPTNGIGGWTDGEIAYLLRTGIKKDGRYAPPYMPKFPNMANEDLEAIIAFLRSDDNLVAPDPTPSQESYPSFLTKFLCRVAFKPLPLPNETIALPDSADVLKLGKYYAHNLDCFACHSSDFKTIDPLNPENSEGYFAGGNKPLDMQGNIVITQNLTPDPETGIGQWSKEKFIKAVKYGLKEGEPALRYPMQPYIYLEDYEVGAIYEYLMTLQPVKNDVKRSGI